MPISTQQASHATLLDPAGGGPVGAHCSGKSWSGGRQRRRPHDLQLDCKHSIPSHLSPHTQAQVAAPRAFAGIVQTNTRAIREETVQDIPRLKAQAEKEKEEEEEEEGRHRRQLHPFAGMVQRNSRAVREETMRDIPRRRALVEVEEEEEN